MERVKRKQISVVRENHGIDSSYGEMTPAEALLFVWELTKEIYSLTGKHDVESGLRRDIVTITKAQR